MPLNGDPVGGNIRASVVNDFINSLYSELADGSKRGLD